MKKINFLLFLTGKSSWKYFAQNTIHESSESKQQLGNVVPTFF